jgi:threonine dehydratase
MTYPALRAGLRDFVLASEAMIAQSVRDLWRITHNLPEGAGAAGLAGLRLLAPQLAGKTVGLVMCGGNLDAERAAHILLGGMPHFPSGTDEGQAIGGRGPSHRLPSSS